MNIYNAIMKAADQIERKPDQFDFMSCNRPKCGSPGCALGWIGVSADQTIRTVDGDFAWTVAENFLQLPDPFAFYSRMKGLCGSEQWKFSAPLCAATLRLYAEKYHGHEKPKTFAPPNWNTIAASPLIPDHVRSEEAVS